MEMIKKYLNYILIGCACLFGLLVFATMAGSAVYAKSGNNIASLGSVYYFAASHSGLLGTSKPVAACVSGIIFLVFGLVAIAATGVLEFVLKNEYAKYAAVAAGVLLLASAISYFCPATGDLKDLHAGAGSILSGIFALISTCSICSFGCLKLLKK